MLIEQLDPDSIGARLDLGDSLPRRLPVSIGGSSRHRHVELNGLAILKLPAEDFEGHVVTLLLTIPNEVEFEQHAVALLQSPSDLALRTVACADR